MNKHSTVNFNRNQELLARLELPFALQKEVVNFSWGEVQDVHHIGDIWVIEYDSVGTDPLTGEEQERERFFHAYLYPAAQRIGGDEPYDAHHSFSTLEGAVIHAIADKWDGINTRAHTYFMRAIGHGEQHAVTR